jgi:hypothetical protein
MIKNNITCWNVDKKYCTSPFWREKFEHFINFFLITQEAQPVNPGLGAPVSRDAINPSLGAPLWSS